MRQNNISKWNYSSDLNNLLFFAQKLDELLFHYSTDSYRYPVLSLSGLASEYRIVYNDVKRKIISEKNLDHIVEEFVYCLKQDNLAKEILTKEYSNRFTKDYKSWSHKTQYENLLYVQRKFGNRTYYNKLVEQLRLCIERGKEKKSIDKYSALLVRELINYGYDENYIYKTLHDVFFHQPVESIESFDRFINHFDFEEKQFVVYIGYSQDISCLLPLFKKMRIDGTDIELVNLNSVPVGIKTKRQKTILRFTRVKSLDYYSAYDFVKTISSLIIEAHSFYLHRVNTVKAYGQVIDGENQIHTIHSKELLKHRVSPASLTDANDKAAALLSITLSSYENVRDITKLTEIHNSAVYAENTSDSLLGLWSILEAQCDNDEKESDTIGLVKNNLIPFLKSTYVKKLVNTCMMDIERWNKKFFEENILSNGYGSNNIEHTFAFLAFEDQKKVRDELNRLTEEFPLLRYRVWTLHENLKSTKNIRRLIENHTRRVEWHIHRIYRARNYIIHDGARNDEMNQELVVNLHSYVDLMFTEIISIIKSSPYRDSINNAVIFHKLAVSILDEQMLSEGDCQINCKNALKYLYYDFEKSEMQEVPKAFDTNTDNSNNYSYE